MLLLSPITNHVHLHHFVKVVSVRFLHSEVSNKHLMGIRFESV